MNNNYYNFNIKTSSNSFESIEQTKKQLTVIEEKVEQWQKNSLKRKRENETEDDFPPAKIARIDQGVPSCFGTLQLMKLFNLNQVPLGEFMPFDVFLNHCLPVLSVQDIHRLLLTHKDFLKLLQQPDVIDRLCANPKTDLFKLSFVAGPLFKDVDLSDKKWNEEKMMTFIRNCPNLKELSFPFVTGITSACMQALAQGCPHLVSLNLEMLGIGDEELAALDGCPNLTHLNVGGNNLTDKSLKIIAKNWPNLTQLDFLGDCDEEITGEGLSALVKSCRMLQRLNLSWLDIKDEEILSFAQPNPNLTYLGLMGVDATDDAICVLIQNSPNLLDVILSDTQATDKSIYALARHCPNLASLDIKGLLISASALSVLLEHCPNLSVITLDDDLEEGEAIRELAENYPALILNETYTL